MPVGIKDIIETANMPTEMGSPLFTDWQTRRDAASVVALREAGAIILGKTVTTEFAATEPRGTRNPWDLARTPGGSSSGSAAAVAAGLVSAALGSQGIASTVRPASYCGCFGFKPSLGAINRGGSYDDLSQSCVGILGATLDDTWQVAREIALRAGGDPGYSPLIGPARLPAARKPRALAVLETAGWDSSSPAARAELHDAVERIRRCDVTILTRHSNREIAALESHLIAARSLSHRINAWESRWPLNTYRDRDAPKLSRTMLDRLAQSETMTADEYLAALAERNRLRSLHAVLAAQCDACITLAAPGAAPVGLNSTGDPTFAVPFTLLGVPAISLPLLSEQNLPLGLQVAGFGGFDAEIFATAAWLTQELTSDEDGRRQAP
jgi:Asp-tRNA(Asn)/Glu-tRNA(Gln) amidotransferase A subunit family amidase